MINLSSKLKTFSRANQARPAQNHLIYIWQDLCSCARMYASTHVQSYTLHLCHGSNPYVHIPVILYISLHKKPLGWSTYGSTPPPRTNWNSPRKMMPLSTIVENSNGSTCTTRHRALLYLIGNKKLKKIKINLQKHQVSDPCSTMEGGWRKSESFVIR